MNDDLTALAEAMLAKPAVGHLHELEPEHVVACRAHATGAITRCVVCDEWVFVPPASTAQGFVLRGLEPALRMVAARVNPDELRPPCPDCGGYPSVLLDGTYRCRDCGRVYSV